MLFVIFHWVIVFLFVICYLLHIVLFVDALCDCWDLLFCPHLPLWWRRQCNYRLQCTILLHRPLLQLWNWIPMLHILLKFSIFSKSQNYKKSNVNFIALYCTTSFVTLCSAVFLAVPRQLYGLESQSVGLSGSNTYTIEVTNAKQSYWPLRHEFRV